MPLNLPGGLSVVVPMYNEANRIRPCLERLSAYLSDENVDFEVVVADDGSTDGCTAIVESFSQKDSRIRLVRSNSNRGKGNAVKRGMLAAQKSFVLFTDVDLSAPIEELGKLVPFLGNHDVVIGSRDAEGAVIEKKQRKIRRFLRRGYRLLLRLFLNLGFKDTQCGFKLFKREAAQNIFQRATIDAFGFDVEALYLAKLLDYRVQEVGVRWRDDRDSKLNFLVVPAEMFFDLLKINRNRLRGRYR